MHVVIQSTSRSATELLAESQEASDRNDLDAAQERFLSIVERKANLELDGQNINNARMTLANTVDILFTMSSQLDTGSIAAQTMQKTIDRLQIEDKTLEIKLRRIDTQQQTIQTEIHAIQRVIDRNIDMRFKTFG